MLVTTISIVAAVPISTFSGTVNSSDNCGFVQTVRTEAWVWKVAWATLPISPATLGTRLIERIISSLLFNDGTFHTRMFSGVRTQSGTALTNSVPRGTWSTTTTLCAVAVPTFRTRIWNVAWRSTWTSSGAVFSITIAGDC